MTTCKYEKRDGCALHVRDYPLLSMCRIFHHMATKVPFGITLCRRIGRPVRNYYRLRILEELVVSFEGTLRIAVRLNDQIESQVFWWGFQIGDWAALGVIKRYLKDHWTIVDVGANVGTFSLPLARCVPRGEVHAFEPVRETNRRLRENIKANRLENIYVNEMALSKYGDAVWIVVPDNEGSESMNNPGRASLYYEKSQGNAYCVPSVTLDDYVRRMKLGSVDIMKMDIEGSELDVLKGAESTIRQFRPVIVLEVNRRALNRAGVTVGEVSDFFAKIEYKQGIIRSGARIDWSRGPFDDDRHQNVICVPRNQG